MSKPMRILVLSVSAGAGHVRAAQAICATAANSFPDLETVHLDVLDLVPAGFRKFYGSGYIKLVEKAPQLWAYLYQRTDHPPASSLGDRFRRQIERLNTRKLDDEIARIAPDAIVCTHFLPAELLSRRIAKGRATPPVWINITDFDVHGLWLHPHIHGYFVATEEVAVRLAARGIPAEQIHVTGIAIMPQFSTPPARDVAAAELGLDPAKTTLLMMSGGAGVGGIEMLVEQAAAQSTDTQIVALAGRNAELLQRLQEIAARYPGRIHPQGFTRTIERVMAAADLAITKPGGLTTSECLAMQLPMIVVSPIPGQEERNADTLLESGCALKAVDAAALGYKIRLLAEDPARLAQMRQRQKALARPQAARAILDIVRARQ
ncbi:MAG: galactosyldiacylglycerol synthase [Proteobacteria bacterium]|nr:galactosyldiacylglycerol synthase [Pseudomonadota bacterium]